MIRMAAFDIDRTLIPVSTRIMDPRIPGVIEALKRRGIKVIVASGRQWQQVPRALKALDFDGYILLNGTHMTDGTGKTLCRSSISLEMTQALIAETAGKDQSLYLRFEEGMYPVLRRDREIPFGTRLKEASAELLEGLLMESPLEQGSLPMAALAMLPPEDERRLREKFPELDFMRVLGGKNCDINPKGVSKATGLEKMCALLGIGMEEVIAFGDDRNDMEMLRDAGIGVAMGDADETALSVADYVTDTCENLGAVKALEHFGLL